jgi:hypothetical protein
MIPKAACKEASMDQHSLQEQIIITTMKMETQLIHMDQHSLQEQIIITTMKMETQLIHMA